MARRAEAARCPARPILVEDGASVIGECTVGVPAGRRLAGAGRGLGGAAQPANDEKTRIARWPSADRRLRAE
jgi:hypothetical protein